MCELRYPVGMATFSELIEEGYAYVDKTGYIKPLLKQGKFIFLSRPRRFGKSLLLSTLKAYFEGRRELFSGLAADNLDLDWTPSPVLRFDFNAEDFEREDGLERLIDGFLRDYEEIYGSRTEDKTLSQRFKYLIKTAYERTGQKVVILIDEYDKPLLALEENREQFEKNQRLLKSFFGNLKTMDEYIRFAFITGVARFTKVSVFSDLNNLKDISMDNEYSDICGWTENELLDNFRPGIEALAAEREEDFHTTLLALRNYYDGYLFSSKGSHLYNPFSILSSLDEKEIEPYWFITGTPSFLARWVKNNGMYPHDINGVRATKTDLISVGFDSMNPVPLMFQTGYLSIESYDRESQLFTLRLPNKEVEIGFYRNLLSQYVPATGRLGSPFDFTRFKSELIKGDIQGFMKRLKTLLKDLPGEDHSESTYRAVTYLLAVLCGTQAERLTIPHAPSSPSQSPLWHSMPATQRARQPIPSPPASSICNIPPSYVSAPIVNGKAVFNRLVLSRPSSQFPALPLPVSAISPSPQLCISPIVNGKAVFNRLVLSHSLPRMVNIPKANNPLS